MFHMERRCRNTLIIIIIIIMIIIHLSVIELISILLACIRLLKATRDNRVESPLGVKSFVCSPCWVM